MMNAMFGIKISHFQCLCFVASPLSQGIALCQHIQLFQGYYRTRNLLGGVKVAEKTNQLQNQKGYMKLIVISHPNSFTKRASTFVKRPPSVDTYQEALAIHKKAFATWLKAHASSLKAHATNEITCGNAQITIKRAYTGEQVILKSIF